MRTIIKKNKVVVFRGRDPKVMAYKLKKEKLAMMSLVREGQSASSQY